MQLTSTDVKFDDELHALLLMSTFRELENIGCVIDERHC